MKFEDLRKGDKVWYWKLSFSDKKLSGRPLVMVKPVEVEVVELTRNDGSESRYYNFAKLEYTEIKKTGPKTNIIVYYKFGETGHIAKTKEEAIEEFNARILTRKDQIVSSFQEALHLLEEKLI